MPNLSVEDVVVGEGDGELLVVVKLDAPSSNTVTVDYRQSNSSAGENTDYRYKAGTLSFAPGETSKTVRIELVNGAVIEGPEQFYFLLSKATNAALSRDQALIQIVDNDTIVDSPQLFVRDVVVDEKAGTATFAVRLGNRLGESSASTVTVNYSTVDGTAVAGQDFIARSGTLSFAPGESVKIVVVDLVDDTLAEGLERFNFQLTGAVNASIVDGVSVAEIALSDGTTASLPRMSVGDYVVGEGDGYVDVEVRLHAPSSNAISVDYRQGNSSAGENTDYLYQAGTLNFAAGETSKVVRLALVNNQVAEGSEQFYFLLSKVTNAALSREQALIQIVDNDTIVDSPKVFVRDVVVDEKAGSATFAVRLGNREGESSASTVSVNYSTVDGTAIAGQDFIARSGTLSFAPGESVKTVVVDLVDDTLLEGLERFNFQLSSAVNAAIVDGVAVAEIALSDGTTASLPRMSVADYVVGEGDGYVDVEIRLHAPSSNAISVDYRQGNSSAGENSDYLYQAGTLNFAAGETSKVVRLALVNNQVAEGSEQFYFLLSKVTNAALSREQALIQIVDNDTIVDSPKVFVRDVVVDEKAGSATFAVRLGNREGESSASTVSVNYSTVDGTAIAGQDFIARSGTLSFAPGESVKTVVVDLVDDTLLEGLERFNFQLSSAVNAAIVDGVAVAEIALSDGTTASLPRMSVADYVVGEGDGYVDVEIRLHAPSSNAISVDYRQGNSSAGENSDYLYQAGTLNFAAGETSKVVRLALVDNLALESSETFTFLLQNVTNATLFDATADIIIRDDDDAARTLLNYGRSNDVYTINDTNVDFLEATDGGYDIVRSSVSFTLPATLEGLILTGAALNAVGNEAANYFQGNSQSNTIDGRGGIDTVQYPGADSAYNISGANALLAVGNAALTNDTLIAIERLRFDNKIVAYDTSPGGNTWSTYALLNAAFNAAPSTAMLSQWTSQLDQLGSLRSVAQALINYYAPGVSNQTLVTHLWGTIVGTPISQENLDQFTGMIANGTFTQASLLEFVATHSLNTAEIVSIVGQPVALDPAWFPLLGV
jgi:hypothetical protein